MRLATLTAVGLIAASTAALAQVAGTPTEQKTPPPGASPMPDDTMPMGNNMAAPDAGDKGAAANTMPPPANDMAPAMPQPPKARARRR